MIRKAAQEDIKKITSIYNNIHKLEKSDKLKIGWIENVYPTEETAQKALLRNDLFVYEKDGEILASAIINNEQLDTYKKANWKNKADDNQVMVLHTLVVDPKASKQGIGKEFLMFYERYAKENNCYELRMDTNAINKVARSFYQKNGYSEVDILPCEFNGIPNIRLVLLEKELKCK